MNKESVLQKLEEGALPSGSLNELDLSTSKSSAVINKLKNSLNNLQQRIDMVAEEDASFEETIKSLEHQRALQHSVIESHINYTKNIIDQNFREIEDHRLPNETIEFDFQRRKLNEVLAYRNYELSKYLREELELKRKPMLGGQPKEAQYQNGIDILLRKIKNTGISESKVSTEKCKLISAHLIKKKENLQIDIKTLKENLTALETESSELKLLKEQNEEYDAIKLKVDEKITKLNACCESVRHLHKGLNKDYLKWHIQSCITALSEELSEELSE